VRKFAKVVCEVAIPEGSQFQPPELTSNLSGTKSGARHEYGTARERTTRVVEPHYLLLAWPARYLLVWDYLRAAIRTLRLDRIESARLTDSSFKLRDADSMMLVARDLFAPL
jgi:hypothetical protein